MKLKLLFFLLTMVVVSCKSNKKILKSQPKVIKDNYQMPIISADRGNLLYKAIDNPITISVPGISSNKVSVNGIGILRVKGTQYIMRPRQDNETTIHVSAIRDDGKRIVSNKVFRVKDLPTPFGVIDGKTNYVRLNKKDIEITKIEVYIPEFNFDVSFNVMSFSVFIPNKGVINVKGNMFDQVVKKVLKKMKNEDLITVFNIKSTLVGNEEYEINIASPIIIEIE